jgi:hypothetical protein
MIWKPKLNTINFGTQALICALILWKQKLNTINRGMKTILTNQSPISWPNSICLRKTHITHNNFMSSLIIET